MECTRCHKVICENCGEPLRPDTTIRVTLEIPHRQKPQIGAFDSMLCLASFFDPRGPYPEDLEQRKARKAASDDHPSGARSARSGGEGQDA